MHLKNCMSHKTTLSLILVISHFISYCIQQHFATSLSVLGSLLAIKKVCGLGFSCQIKCARFSFQGPRNSINTRLSTPQRGAT